MGCEDCREAISAALDGEALPGEEAAVAAHVARCGDCRGFAERAATVTRLTRTRPAEPVPDLTAAVLAASPRRRVRPGFVRAGLGAVGLAQLGLAVAGMVGAGEHHGGVELAGASAAHLANESSAWSAALAVGFLWAAVGGVRAAGLLPVMTAFVAVLTALSVLDAVTGRVEPSRLLGHAVVVVGLLLLLALPRARGDGDGAAELAGPGPLHPTGTDATVLSVRPGTGLEPSARHRAA